MARTPRKSYYEMFKYYSLGIPKGNSINVLLPITKKDKGYSISIPNFKKPSYRDVAKKFGYSLRAIEKIGSNNHWYLKRKYFEFKMHGELPRRLKWIYE